MANDKDPMLVKYGGGVKDIEVYVIDSRVGPMVVTHLIVDCRDAMGANAVNTMAEALGPQDRANNRRQGLPEDHLQPGRSEASESQSQSSRPRR